MEYFETFVRLPEIETKAKALPFSYIMVDASSTPSVNILEIFNAYEYRIILS